MDTTVWFQPKRQAMVEDQLRSRGIRDPRVLDAMAAVPRHEFVPEDQIAAAYADRALPIGEWQTVSQPFIVALMTEAAAVHPGDNVLEVGTGAGYQAAILAELGAHISTIEMNPELAENARSRLSRLGYSDAVRVITGDGSEGYPDAAPFDAVLVTAGSPSVPRPLIDQLADGGRLVIPIGSRREQELELIMKSGDKTYTRPLVSCQFVPLLGKEGWSGDGRWHIF